MYHKELAPERILRVYCATMHQAILNLRMRIRYGEIVDLKEVADIMSAIENIPKMICSYDGWHVESNIQGPLDDYDKRRPESPDQEMRSSMARLFKRAADMQDVI